MVEKFILIVLFGILGFFVGKSISKNKKNVRDYIYDVSRFCTYARNDIAYKQTKLNNLVEDFEYKSNEFEKDLKSYYKTKVFASGVKLRQEDEGTIQAFLTSIGGYDMDTQLAVLDLHGKKLSNIYEHYDKKYKKEGSVCVQLGFLIGICLGILVV